MLASMYDTTPSLRNIDAMINLRCLLGLVLALANAAHAQVDDNESHANIRAVATAYAEAHADEFGVPPVVEAEALDRRLRLARCSVPLEAFASPNGLRAGRSVVGVRCEGTKPWKLYVGIRIALPEMVVVTARPIARGEALQATDLLLREQDVAGLNKTYFTDPQQLLGLRARRTLTEGRVITARMVQRARLVQRGEQVLITGGTGGVQVQMMGKALTDGSRGDRIEVQNNKSARVVTGTVTGPGVVEVAH